MNGSDTSFSEAMSSVMSSTVISVRAGDLTDGLFVCLPTTHAAIISALPYAQPA